MIVMFVSAAIVLGILFRTRGLTLNHLTTNRGTAPTISKALRLQMVSINSEEYARPLGGYEKLLSRKTPGGNTLSLSHAATFLLNSAISHEKIVEAAMASIER